MKYLAITIPRKELGRRAEARNKEIERALKLEADYILMVDEDEAMPFGAINKLFYWISEYDAVVIDAPSSDGLAQSNITYHPDGTIAWTGFGCVLFKAEIFKKLPKPWFDDKSAYTFEIKKGRYVFSKVEKYKADNIGEDVDFYFKLIENGFKIKILEGVKCKHIQL